MSVEEMDQETLFEELHSPLGRAILQELKNRKEEFKDEISELAFETDENSRFKAVGIKNRIDLVDELFDFINSLKKEGKD